MNKWFGTPITQDEKLAWLRENVDSNLPDIYHLQRFKPNGCGADTWRFDVVPDHFPGLPDFSVAGDYHDYLYWLGGSSGRRYWADTRLRWIMQNLIKDAWHWVARLRMNALGQIYFLAVRAFGRDYFNYQDNVVTIGDDA